MTYMRRRHGKTERFLIMNIAIPILFGAVMYLMIDPDVMFVKLLNANGLSFRFGSGIVDCPVISQCARFYLPDMLWGYSLVFAMFFFFEGGKAMLPAVAISAVLFSVIVECAQIIPKVPGSFDFIDIVVEIAAELLAVFIIKIKREDLCYED